MNQNEKFISIISKRSNENLKSFNLLFSEKLYGNCMSVIRMELDTYIRLYYFENNCGDRESMLKSFFNGERLKTNWERT